MGQSTTSSFTPASNNHAKFAAMVASKQLMLNEQPIQDSHERVKLLNERIQNIKTIQGGMAEAYGIDDLNAFNITLEQQIDLCHKDLNKEPTKIARCSFAMESLARNVRIAELEKEKAALMKD